MFLVSSCCCLCPIHWSQVLSWEWRCSWSSADRRCSNYIWVTNNFIAYKGVSYIRDFTVFIKRGCWNWNSSKILTCIIGIYWFISNPIKKAEIIIGKQLFSWDGRSHRTMRKRLIPIYPKWIHFEAYLQHNINFQENLNFIYPCFTSGLSKMPEDKLIEHIEEWTNTTAWNRHFHTHTFLYQDIFIIMTSSNGNILCVTGPLFGNSLVMVNFPTKASDAELWCFLWSTPE